MRTLYSLWVLTIFNVGIVLGALDTSDVSRIWALSVECFGSKEEKVALSMRDRIIAHIQQVNGSLGTLIFVGSLKIKDEDWNEFVKQWYMPFCKKSCMTVLFSSDKTDGIGNIRIAKICSFFSDLRYKFTSDALHGLNIICCGDGLDNLPPRTWLKNVLKGLGPKTPIIIFFNHDLAFPTTFRDIVKPYNIKAFFTTNCINSEDGKPRFFYAIGNIPVVCLPKNYFVECSWNSGAESLNVKFFDANDTILFSSNIGSKS